jgi:hypothetical protein
MTDTALERRPRGRPRTTGGHTCDRCGRSTGKIRIRWPDGKICGIYFHEATRGLGDGTVPLTHDGFDAAPESPAREHIRELLVHHQLLPRRDPDLARFERWLQQRLDAIEDPTVRRPLEQFSTWHHLRRIRRRVGQELRRAVHTSKQEITEVDRFLTWLAERDTTIYTCRQADVDE